MNNTPTGTLIVVILDLYMLTTNLPCNIYIVEPVWACPLLL